MQAAAPLPGPGAVGSALERVYARPEFAPPPRSPVREWLGELWSAILGSLDRLFGGLPLGEGGLRVLSWMVLALLAVVTVVVLAHLVGLAAGGRWGRGRVGRIPGSGTVAAAPPGAAAWEEAAQLAASEGRWRDAALALYQAVLLRLHDAGTLRFDPAKTPGDYRREARRDPEAGRALDAFLRALEPVAFGARPPDRRAWERLRSLAPGEGALG